MCKKTCGMCEMKMECADDTAGLVELAGDWGVKECSKELCEGDYAEMVAPFCKKTCGHCDHDDHEEDDDMTCGAVKKMYKRNGCCGNPSKPFEGHRRLQSATLRPLESSVIGRIHTELANAQH